MIELNKYLMERSTIRAGSEWQRYLKYKKSCIETLTYMACTRGVFHSHLVRTLVNLWSSDDHRQKNDAAHSLQALERSGLDLILKHKRCLSADQERAILTAKLLSSTLTERTIRNGFLSTYKLRISEEGFSQL